MPKTLTRAPERDGHELTLRRALGPALISARGWSTDEVKTNYDRAQRLCEALGDEEALFEVLRGLWQFHLTRTDLVQCLELGKQMLDQAHRAPGKGRELDADYALGATYIWRGEFERAREHFEAGRERYERQGDTGLGDKSRHSASVVCLYLGAQTFWCLVYPDRARALIEEARELAAWLSLPFSIAISTLQSAFTQLHCRSLGQTAELAEEGYRVAAKYGFPALSAELDIVQGWAAAMSGRLSEGMAQMQLGLDAFAEMGLLLQRPCYQILMAEMHIECSAINAAENALDEAGALARETAEGYAEAEWHRVAAKLHIARNNDVAGTVACLHDALRIAEAQGCQILADPRGQGPRTALGEPWPEARGRGVAGADLRLVHRRVGHARSQRGKGAPRRTGLSPRVAVRSDSRPRTGVAYAPSPTRSRVKAS